MGNPPSRLRTLLRRRAVWLGLVGLGLLLGGLGGLLAYRHYADREAQRHRERAEEALERYDLAAAREELRRYAAARPDGAEGHFLLARTLRREGQFDEAARELKEAGRLGWDAQ